MPEASAKICVICGKSCAGEPRIRNERGQYAHRACAEAHQKAAHTAPRAEPDDALGMDDLLADLDDSPEVEQAPMRSACPSCGFSLAPGAVICMSCGYNTSTGKTLTSKVHKVRDTGAATAAAAKAGGIAALPVLWAIGGCIGGAVGAAIWAAIAYFTGFEVGYVAVGVGALVGVGVHAASMGRGSGAAAGAVAALIAMASIAAGKYAAVHFSVVDFLAEEGILAFDAEDVNDEWLLTSLAEDELEKRIQAGQVIEWPNPESATDAAWWPDDYPEDVRIEVLAAYDGMSEEELDQRRQRVADEYNDENELAFSDRMRAGDVEEDWLLDEMATSAVHRRIREGEVIPWPDPTTPLRGAAWPDDYPPDALDVAQARFDSMSTDARDALREEIAYETGRAMEEASRIITDMATGQGFLHSFGPFDVLWMLLAVGAAFGIASGESLIGD